ncbi:hypothetical protein B0533_02680 [Sedimentibacter sp. SX930]|nr:hypothetical protein B0533_02680 [Sedimentibacter sp. SX930]
MLTITKSEKNSMIFENLYLILYSVILTINLLGTTMFYIPWPKFTTIVLLEVMLIILGAKIILIDKRNNKEMFLYLILFIGFFGAFLNTGYAFLIFDLILILGAKNVSFKKVIKLFCVISGIIIIITMLSSQFGLVENLIYERGNRSRISFGFEYPTDFTAHIFYLVMGYCYLRKEKLMYLELAGIFALSLFTYIFCDARTNAISLFMTFAVFLYLKIRNQASGKKGTCYVMNPKFSKILAFAMPLCAFAFIALTFLYHFQPTNSLMKAINKLVSGRLELGAVGFERYGFSFFGNAFQMNGFGGSTSPRMDYFFLDSSYVLLLIRYGSLVLLAVLVIFSLVSLRAEKQKDFHLLWILALIAVQCTIEHHLLEIAYNPFLFLLLTESLSLKKSYLHPLTIHGK